jgi:hypothetical protein
MITVAAGSNTRHDPTSDWNLISAAWCVKMLITTLEEIMTAGKEHIVM